MDFQFIKERPTQFAKQVYKYYDEDENIIKNYLCKEHLLILSTKKLYVFYAEAYVDYTYDYLKTIDFTFNDELRLSIKGKDFNVSFLSELHYDEFKMYINKYNKKEVTI